MGSFLEHINKMDPAIKFTVECNQENGPIPFLDTMLSQKQTIPYPLQCTGNLCTLISTYKRITTIT